MAKKLSLATRIVDRFLDGNLSVILILLALLAGAAALALTPREEEPQIVVPMADIYVHMPGASAAEVERQVSTRLEKLLWQVDGVEYVYSMSKPDLAVVTARFFVGEDRVESLVKLHNKVQTNIDAIPAGITGWVVKPVEVDDVPIVNLSLYSDQASDFELRRVAEEVVDRLQSVKNTSVTTVIGGRPRQLRVALDPQALAARGLGLLDVRQALDGANLELPAGDFQNGNQSLLVRGGEFLRSARDVGDLVIGVVGQRPVQLREVARIEDGPAEAASYTRLRFGPAGDAEAAAAGREYQAVNIAVAKKKGTNAVVVAAEVIRAVDDLKGTIIPDEMQVRVTRNYGETANHKVNELITHLIIAVVTVLALVFFALGWREALIVAVSIPIIYSLTLLVNYWFGYTINRVTLFALVLALGLLVDDPIVDVENIFRHFQMKKEPPRDAVLSAVDEVRPPVILATLAVILSFLPMLYITGMMGPYMRPMAFNLPLTMIMSLLVAFTVTPWMSYHLLKGQYGKGGHEFVLEESRTYRIYRRILEPFIDSRRKAWLLVAAVVLLLLGSMAMPVLNLVPMKMLPFDNKNEFQLVLDLPEGTTLETTDAAVRALEDYLGTVNEVTDFEAYVGLASAMDFNGMVRHYYMRRGENVADIRVNLAPKSLRAQQSHPLTLRLRDDLTRIARAHGVNLKIVEVPPGPPVISTLAAEVYADAGISYGDQIAAAKLVRARMESEDRVVDVDDMVEAPQRRLTFLPDKEKASLSGISTAEIARTLALAVGGEVAGTVHVDSERQPLQILLRLPAAVRSAAADLGALALRGQGGKLVHLSELGRFVEERLEPTIFHKNLERVVYVTGEMAGKSPANAILNLSSHFKANPLPTGTRVVWNGEGEWQITLDVFRDLGIAFGAALVLIFILLLIETGSMVMPLIIMAAIPLTMIGIMPGFWLLNLIANRPVGGYDTPVFFTATAMIGMIALAGIVVRNSIILIDFIHHALKRGMPLKEAIIESGAVRLRPILLTAGAALLGNWIITLDPIFSGLAWSIIFGVFASTAFTLIVIPVVYWLVYGKKAEQHARRYQS
ncbi:efflux RND transporter permease subunit [Desulfuromonas carbonis]|uniref:efflux RND transporter permease subunit n=1 Tax=Desulfuromonas sp. DDH964 TaxID=1823759 RepID=UPI00078E6E98|nr:efflux RND transporter permease subunit [Desulfuromonas sp. DDH964]AMV73929.1 RND family efflux pump inner membrane protein [Desulfuromonas sp. DDH964]